MSVANSTIADNHGIGVHAEGGTISVLDSRLVSNHVAVQADPLGTVRLSNNDVMNNKTGFGCGGGFSRRRGTTGRPATSAAGSPLLAKPTITVQ